MSCKVDPNSPECLDVDKINSSNSAPQDVPSGQVNTQDQDGDAPQEISTEDSGVSAYSEDTGQTLKKVDEQKTMCARLFEPFSNQYDHMSQSQRSECARGHYDMSKIGDYEFIVNGKSISNDPEGLVRTKATYTVSKMYYEELQNPKPVQKLLTKLYLKVTGRKKVPINIELKPHQNYTGLASLNKGLISIVDSLSDYEGQTMMDIDDSSTWISRSMSVGTLNHELGHHLMYHFYKRKFPDYEGHWGHAKGVESLAEAIVNPGSAWAEGFADAMAEIEYPSRERLVPYDLVRSGWYKLSLRETLSNEFVIKHILDDYIRSEWINADGFNMSGVNDASIARLNKIFICMVRSGLQADFQEFVVDFLFQFPEEKEKFMKVLTRWRMSHIAQAPHVVERFIDRMNSFEQPVFGLGGVKAKIHLWERMKHLGVVEKHLMNPDLSPKKRIENMRIVANTIENYATTAYHIDGPVL
jgi:hypothetical protein